MKISINTIFEIFKIHMRRMLQQREKSNNECKAVLGCTYLPEWLLMRLKKGFWKKRVKVVVDINSIDVGVGLY